LVIVPGFVSNVELQWEDLPYRSFVRRLARFSTVVRFDKRGTGLSDPVRDLPTLAERKADLTAVIDDSGVVRPVLVGISDGGPIAIQLAASRGDVLAGLVLYGTSAQARRQTLDKLLAAGDNWGTGQTIELFAPSLAGDAAARAARGRFERESASPAMARALAEALALIDVRELLPQITLPTLVLFRTGDRVQSVESVRYLASQITSARLVELEGADHLPWLGDSQSIVNEIERFVRTVRPDQDGHPYQTELRPTRPLRPVTGWASLTPREQAVAALVGEGCSNPVIADRLYISRYTVETHLKHIFAKVGVDSRTALVRLVGDLNSGTGNT
jgi:pimeloyl-ACP methyl ester carboxylesterase/DNA-binding CsgD family transcriptional regulator